MSPSTALELCMYRNAHNAPFEWGPSSASRHASTASSATSVRTARCGMTRPGSGWFWTGFWVGTSEPVERLVSGMTEVATEGLLRRVKLTRARAWELGEDLAEG